MIGPSLRWLYRQLLRLYPEPFRREFEDEMVSVFEECRRTDGAARLLMDALLSAARQQLHYVASPMSKSAVFSSVIGSSSKSARIFAAAILSVELTAGALAGRPAAPPSLPKIHPDGIRAEALFWFSMPGWGRYCSAAPDAPGTTESGMVAGVLVARKLEAPKSWRIVRMVCGHERPSKELRSAADKEAAEK